MPSFIVQTSQSYFQFLLSPALLTGTERSRAGATPLYLSPALTPLHQLLCQMLPVQFCDLFHVGRHCHIYIFTMTGQDWSCYKVSFRSALLSGLSAPVLWILPTQRGEAGQNGAFSSQGAVPVQPTTVPPNSEHDRENRSIY